jgi:hypothetical protein
MRVKVAAPFDNLAVFDLFGFTLAIALLCQASRERRNVRFSAILSEIRPSATGRLRSDWVHPQEVDSSARVWLSLTRWPAFSLLRCRARAGP